MTSFLRQSTAIDIPIGPFLDATDGVTPETALTLSQADIRLKKNNANWAQKADTSSATHEEFGWYEVSLNTTDTGTVGRLMLSVQESGALPVWLEFTVLEEAVYDALFAASAAGYLTLSTGISLSPTVGTVEEALAGGRASSMGKRGWDVSGNETFKAHDGTTTLVTHVIKDAAGSTVGAPASGSPTSRT